MSYLDHAAEFLRYVRRNPQAAEALLSVDARAVHHLQRGENFYRLFADASGDLLIDLKRILGGAEYWRMAQLIERCTPSSEQLRLVRMLVSDAEHLFGPYQDLRARVPVGLGFILEVDHLVEQRLMRMIMDGPAAHFLRSANGYVPKELYERTLRDRGCHNLAERVLITDGFGALVPANDIAAHGLARGLSGADANYISAYYVHGGLNGKSRRMAGLIPYRLEGEFSYQELFDITRWVICRELGLPRQVERMILADFADAIVHAAQHVDSRLADVVMSGIPRRRRVAVDSPLLFDRVLETFDTAPLPDNFLRTLRQEAPMDSPLAYEAFLREEADRILQNPRRVRLHRPPTNLDPH